MKEQNRKSNQDKTFSFDLENGTNLEIKFVSNVLASAFSDLDLSLTIGKIAQEQNNTLCENAPNGSTEPSFFEGTFDPSTGNPVSYFVGPVSVGTIQVLDWLFTLPSETDDIDTFKAANETIYYAITGRAYTDTAFTSDDLTRLFIAESEILCGMMQCKRAIEACGVTSVNNEAVKSRLIYAMGFDGAKLNGDFSRVINKYNEVVREFNKLTLPVGIPSVDKHVRMCSTLYADDLHAKTQILLFRHHVLYDELAALGENSEMGVIKPHDYFHTLNGPQMDILDYLDALKLAIVRLFDSGSYQSGFNPKLSIAYRLPKELGGMELGPYYQLEELEYLKPPVTLHLEFDHSMFVTVRSIQIQPIYPLMGSTNATTKVTNDTSGAEEYYTLNIWTRSYLGRTYLAQGSRVTNSTLLEPGLVVQNSIGAANMLSDMLANTPVTISKVGTFDSKILDFGHYPYDDLTAATILAEQHRYGVEIMWFKYSGTVTQRRVRFLRETTTEVYFEYTLYQCSYSLGERTNTFWTNYDGRLASDALINAINGLSLHPKFFASPNGAGIISSIDNDNPLRVPYTAIADARKGLWKYAFNYAILAGKSISRNDGDTTTSSRPDYQNKSGKHKGKGKPNKKDSEKSADDKK